jgi:PKD repeat protein
MIGAGDEEKMKKTRQIIVYVILGITIMWLAYPIVKWTTDLLKKTAYEWSVFPVAMAAYTESDSDTFAEYKNKIKESINQMESEFVLNKSVSTTTIQNVKNLVQLGFDRLPDNGDAASTNRESKQFVDTYLSLAIQNPTNSNHIGNAISRVASFLDKVSIGKITGDINAGPPEWNAPLSVSFRADQIKDPSGTTPADNNYIWWTRENGGVRRELSRGPSLSYTFTKEWTYTVFLDVVSGSRNSKWKIDVLPLSVSKQITVKPKLGEILLLINGVNVSNMDKLKISPSIGKMWVILDASASRAIWNGTIAETKWDFGNGESSVNKGWPIVERQIYANQGWYILKLSMKTNDGQTFTKEIQLLLLEPSATIKLDKNTGHIGEDISMSATSYFSDTKNVEYSWQVQDENGNKVVKVGQWINFKHKFETVGSYIVSLTSKSPNGNIDTDSKVITIESREPVVTIDSPHPIKNEKPNTFVFDASKSYDPDSNSRKNLTYTWKIDGQTVALDNIENDWAKWTYTFDNKWTHKVSVVVANVYGKISTTETPFEVTSTLTISIIMTPKVVKRGETITIIGQSSNAEFFEWNMWDSSPVVSGTNRSIQHIYKQSGTYEVRLNVNRDGGSETNSITRKVYVTETDSPFAMIDATNASNSIIEEDGACDNKKALIINRADSTTFNATNSINVDGTTSGLTYTWKYFWKARTTQSITEKFNELGCFPIELTVRSNKNGATHTSTQYIKLTNRPPEITSLSTTLDSAKKDSQKILVKVKANGAIDPDGVITSYIWYFKTESDPEPQNVQITQKDEITFVLPNITEKYYFGVILEDNDGAKINSTELWKSPTPLVVDNSNGNIYLPLITLTTPQTVINVWEKARFSVDVRTIVPGVNITNRAEYAWDYDGDGRIDEKSTLPSIEHIYTKSGDFNMKVRVTNNGVSNSKYQTIHVKNKLKANVNGYKLPDGRIYLLNASEWSYDSARWTIWSTISESLTSTIVGADDVSLSGKLSISSNNTDIDSTEIDFSKIETITGSGVLYQSYPRNSNDIITLKNPTDPLTISMFGNDASNYAIDTDILIDTNLDGTPDNDSDNKNDASYTDGSAYSMRNIGTDNKREHKIKLLLIKDWAIIDTRIITIILDYISATSETDIDLNGSGSVWLSSGDRAKLEELSKMIRELTDSDRIILMQRYNTLVENWNNPFDKAKSLIDLQEGIESGMMDSEKKGKLTKIIDDLLIGDAQVTDEVGIAAILIKDLIPKESPNHDVLIAKLAEIESHPTLLDTNKKLWKEMLVLIETDSTIPDKYKWHIKNQLLVIINWGITSIPTTKTETWETIATSNDTWILGFISGFVKIFFYIIGIILIIGIIAFIFYRLTRKGDSIGFQDFLIDAVFHNEKTPPIPEKIIKSDSIVNGPPPMPKEDPLSSYIPHNPSPAVNPIKNNDTNDIIVEKAIWNVPIINHQSVTNNISTPENIPDWLKVPMAQSIESPVVENLDNKTIELPIEVPLESNIDSIPSGTMENSEIESIISPAKEITLDPLFMASQESNIIPDWIKNTTLAKEDEDTVTGDASIVIPNSIEPEKTAQADEKLPDWLINSLQSEEKMDIGIGQPVTTDNILENLVWGSSPIEWEIKENWVKKTPKKVKSAPIKKESWNTVTNTGNIPDWLK